MDPSQGTAFHISRLAALLRASQVIHSTLEQRESLELILGEAVRLVGADSGLLALINPTTGFLEIEAAQGLPPGARSVRLRLGEGLPGRVARSGHPALVAEAADRSDDLRLRGDVACELAVPLRMSGEVRGV